PDEGLNECSRPKFAEMSTPKTKSFESSLEELERIVRELEQGELPLEKSLELFEQGVKLSRECQERLNQAERRIEILIRDNQGRPTMKPLEAGEVADNELSEFPCVLCGQRTRRNRCPRISGLLPRANRFRTRSSNSQSLPRTVPCTRGDSLECLRGRKKVSSRAATCRWSDIRRRPGKLDSHRVRAGNDSRLFVDSRRSTFDGRRRLAAWASDLSCEVR